MDSVQQTVRWRRAPGAHPLGSLWTGHSVTSPLQSAEQILTSTPPSFPGSLPYLRRVPQPWQGPHLSPETQACSARRQPASEKLQKWKPAVFAHRAIDWVTGSDLSKPLRFCQGCQSISRVCSEASKWPLNLLSLSLLSACHTILFSIKSPPFVFNSHSD